jgi:uncharacterized protein (DUF58 family)
MAGARHAIRLAAALVLAGAFFDSPSLYVPGLALALLAGAAWGWVELATRGVLVERLPWPTQLTEGESLRFAYHLRGGRLPLPGAELHDSALGRPAKLGSRPGERLELEVDFPRRGRVRLDPPRLRLADPLGMRSAEIEGTGAGELLVLPRVEPIRWRRDGPHGDAGGDAPEWGGAGGRLELRAPEFEIDGLRPYRPGTPASRIHWATVARRGELIERRVVSGGDTGPLVVLDAGGDPDAESLDRAVRATASLCLHLAQGPGCSLLLPGEARPLRVDPRLTGWPEAHARLALVEPGGPPPAAQRIARRGLVIWVSAAGAPAHPLSAAAYLVSPHPAPGVPVAFTVAGCSGQRAGARRRVQAGHTRSAA